MKYIIFCVLLFNQALAGDSESSVDCFGTWSKCTSECVRVYNIETQAANGGSECPAKTGDEDNGSSCARGQDECPAHTCTNIDCGPDAHRNELLDGDDFDSCCTCSFGRKVGFTIEPRGSFNADSNTFRVEFDVPNHHTVQSISWKDAEDDSLGYILSSQPSLWQYNEQNECRGNWILEQELDTFFGPGTTFTVNGNVLSTLMAVKSTVAMTKGDHSYSLSHDEDVEVKIGLTGTKTISATINMQTRDMEEFAFVKGYARKEVGSEEKISLTLQIETTHCVKEKVMILLGSEHISNEESTFTAKQIVDGVCRQDSTFTFVPTGYFSDTISLEFTSVDGETFAVDAEMEYVETSILDYLDFGASMGFYATGTHEESKNEFNLGETVYGLITATPLVNVPLSHIEINVFTLSQTMTSSSDETAVTDILNGGFKFDASYIPNSNDLRLQFDLESSHFHVTVGGHPAICTAEITITYQDGTTIRRQLRRVMTQGTKGNVSGEFAITAEKSVGVEMTIGCHYDEDCNDDALCIEYMCQKIVDVEQPGSYRIKRVNDKYIAITRGSNAYCPNDIGVSIRETFYGDDIFYVEDRSEYMPNIGRHECEDLKHVVGVTKFQGKCKTIKNEKNTRDYQVGDPLQTLHLPFGCVQYKKKLYYNLRQLPGAEKPRKDLQKKPLNFAKKPDRKRTLYCKIANIQFTPITEIYDECEHKDGSQEVGSECACDAKTVCHYPEYCMSNGECVNKDAPIDRLPGMAKCPKANWDLLEPCTGGCKLNWDNGKCEPEGAVGKIQFDSSDFLNALKQPHNLKHVETEVKYGVELGKVVGSDMMESDNMESDSMESDSMESEDMEPEMMGSDNMGVQSEASLGRSDMMGSDMLEYDIVEYDLMASDHMQVESEAAVGRSDMMASDMMESDSIESESMESDSMESDDMQAEFIINFPETSVNAVERYTSDLVDIMGIILGIDSNLITITFTQIENDVQGTTTVSGDYQKMISTSEFATKYYTTMQTLNSELFALLQGTETSVGEHTSCTGDFQETFMNDRPPRGTPCLSECFIESGRWGNSWCWTEENEGNWGAECGDQYCGTSESEHVEQCSTNKYGQDFCNNWCNTDGMWGCGTATFSAHDGRNPSGEDYTCSCDGCSGCTSSWWSDFVDNASDVVNNVVDSASDVVDDVVDSASDVIEDVSEGAEDVWNDVVDYAEDFMDDLSDQNCQERTQSSECHQISDRETCLTSTESRDFQHSGVEIHGLDCVWCENGCLSGSDGQCEPKEWLEAQSNKKPFENCLQKSGSRTIRAEVGPSEGNSIDYDIGVDGARCPEMVDRSNWIGDDPWDDEFSISVNGPIVTVTRIDDNTSGWGMNLQFDCELSGWWSDLVDNASDVVNNVVDSASDVVNDVVDTATDVMEDVSEGAENVWNNIVDHFEGQSTAECVDDTTWNDEDASGPFDCEDYLNRGWCAECGEGPNWDTKWGTLEDHDNVLENCCFSCGCENEDKSNHEEQCSTNKYGFDFCNNWCNTDGIWGCGTATFAAHDSRNPSGEDYTCSCDGCNGCTGGWWSDFLDDASEVIDNVVDGATDVVNDVVDSANDVIEDVSEGAENVWNNVVDHAEDFMDHFEDQTTTHTCTEIDCGADAHRNELLDGHDFDTCCTCSFGKKIGYRIAPRGSFNADTNSFRLEFDVPSHHTVQSISWKHAEDASLGYTISSQGMWQHGEQNECRSNWILEQELGTFFGPGTTFTLHGNVLSSLMAIESSVAMTHGDHSYSLSHDEDVEVKIGLTGTKTISATFNMQTRDIEEFADITGYAERVIGNEDKISFSFHVETTHCVEEGVHVLLGSDHVSNEELTFTASKIVNGVCRQDCTYTFVPTGYFTDIISLEFTSVDGETFAVDADVEYVESSVLDYLDFGASMGFYATDTHVESKNMFRLGETVHGLITVTPLINVPLSNIEVNSYLLSQTDEGVIDILNGDYQFRATYITNSNDLKLQFDLEASHFHVTVAGHPAICTAEITITYQDGTSIRRQLRRQLNQGTKGNASAELTIIESEESVGESSSESMDSNIILADVGSATQNPTVLDLGINGARCPEIVNRSNWLGGDTWDDEFSTSVDGSILTVTRIDTDSDWGMHLQFYCELDDHTIWAYHEDGDCGTHGDDHNFNKYCHYDYGTGDACEEQIHVNECASGIAVKFEEKKDYVLNGCRYFRRAEYRCTSESTSASADDCVGSWGQCNAECVRVYHIEREAANGGSECPANNGDRDDGSSCARGQDECPAHSCNEIDCGPDAHRNELADGHDFDTCCTCSFGQKIGYRIAPRGSFNADRNSFCLEFDVPSHHTVQSISWKHAEDESLGYTVSSQGMWQHVEQNECRSNWILEQELGTFFGSGTTFTLNGNVLSSLMEVESSVAMTHGDHSYSLSHDEDVEVKIGLTGTKTISATFNMQTRDIEAFAYITGYAEKEIGNEDKISFTFHIETTHCVEEQVHVLLGSEHTSNEELTFTTSQIVNGVCRQDCTFTFVPTGYFTDIITLEFSSVDEETFAVDADVEYVESSVLDYLDFGASMGFYATETLVESKYMFRLGETVHGLITVTPLVDVPLANIEVNSYTLSQTEDDLIDIFNGDYQFHASYIPNSNDLKLQFDLDASHFYVTVAGHPAICTAEIIISYQDGTSIRRQLRRELKQGTKGSAIGEFEILSEETLSTAFSETMGNYFATENETFYSILAFTAGLAVVYVYHKRKNDKMENMYNSLLDDEV